MKRILYLLFIFSSVCFGQVQPEYPDFLISVNDNNPATFFQQDPKLSYSNQDNFIISWTDFRNGEARPYAQVFDINRNKVNSNFSLIIDGQAAVNMDKTVLAVKKAFGNPSDALPGDFNLEYVLINPVSSAPPERKNINLYVPDFNEEIEGSENIVSIDNDFYYSTNFGGGLITIKINEDGEIKNLYEENSIVESGVKALACAASGESFLSVWIKDNPAAMEKGLYASLFNSDGTVIVPSLLIEDFLPYSGQVESFDIKAVALNETTYKIFWLNKETKILKSINVLSDGTLEGEAESYSIAGSGISEITEFYITNKRPDGFYLYAAWSSGSGTYTNTFIKYDSEGEINGDIITEETEEVLYSDNIFYGGNGRLFSSEVRNEDIFVSQADLAGGAGIAEKINDDESGSNDINNSLLAYDDNTVYSIWNDELKYYLVKINSEGKLVSARIQILGGDGFMSKDKNLVVTWTKEEGTVYTAGAVLYNPDLEVVSENNFFISRTRKYFDVSIVGETGEGYIGYAAQEGSLKLFTTDKNLAIANVVDAGYSDIYNYKAKVFPAENGTVWVSWADSIRQFNYSLEPLTEAKPGFAGVEEYLGNDRFVCVKKVDISNSDIVHTYIDIKNSNGGIIAGDISIAPNVSNVKVEKIRNEEFIVTYQSGVYYGKVFNSGGKLITDRFEITGTNASIKALDYMVNNGKVYFTWSDTRNTGKGYDVYGNIFKLESITGVEQISSEIPESYSISQNYPNPFNPATTINFDIKNAGQVIIKVYDMLGNEITTLVNEEKNPGKYKTYFDGSSLASGIYYYKITAGSFSETRKMVLLK